MKSFQKAYSVDVNKFTEKKNGMTYLTWSHAWGEFAKIYPDATYEVMKNESGLPCFGDDKLGYMVYTKVTAEKTAHEMWLPVMDFKNKSMMKPTTFDINKAVMRCLTKNLAMFGLGLYIYAGEDLPEVDPTVKDNQTVQNQEYRLKDNLRKQLEAELTRTGRDRAKMKAHYKVDHIYQMTEKQQADAMRLMSKDPDDEYNKAFKTILKTNSLDGLEVLNQLFEVTFKDNLKKLDQLKKLIGQKIIKITEDINVR